jgi:anti-anti-sigma factor
MSIDYTDDEGVRRIQVSGRLDIPGAAAIDVPLTALAASQPMRVILDLEAVECLSSIGLRQVVSNAKAQRQRGGQIARILHWTSAVLMLAALRWVTDVSGEDDTTPAKAGWASGPPTEAPQENGRVVIHVEFIIDPARAAAFHLVMQQTRRARLSQGAIGWELLHDIGEPGRYVEQIVDESWTEHLRRFNRATAADMALRERRLAFHLGESPPVVTRYVVRR